jgi:hypothetical protein
MRTGLPVVILWMLSLPVSPEKKECKFPIHILVESLRRDFSFGKNDNFIFFPDAYGDETNGFTFGTNAAGAQWDGTIYQSGKVDLSWDNI